MLNLKLSKLFLVSLLALSASLARAEKAPAPCDLMVAESVTSMAQGLLPDDELTMNDNLGNAIDRDVALKMAKDQIHGSEELLAALENKQAVAYSHVLWPLLIGINKSDGTCQVLAEIANAE